MARKEKKRIGRKPSSGGPTRKKKGAKRRVTSSFAKRHVPDRLERMYKHVFESSLDRGKSLKTAARIAASTVNKYRSKHAGKGRHPKLVSRGGSRRQYYPGKLRYFGRAEPLVCLEHEMTFKTKAALMAHYRTRHGG